MRVFTGVYPHKGQNGEEGKRTRKNQTGQIEVRGRELENRNRGRRHVHRKFTEGILTMACGDEQEKEKLQK